jgi:hypothetical protein
VLIINLKLKDMNINSEIKEYLKDNLKIELSASINTVKATITLEGEVISSSNTSISTKPIVYGNLIPKINPNIKIIKTL